MKNWHASQCLYYIQETDLRGDWNRVMTGLNDAIEVELRSSCREMYGEYQKIKSIIFKSEEINEVANF